MKKILTTGFFSLASFALALPAFAQQGSPNTGQVDFFIAKIFEYARMGITFLMIAATLYFIWTVIQYITAKDADSRKEYRGKMVAGIVGLFVIVSVWGIVYFIGNTLGLGGGTSPYSLPCPPGTRPIGPAGSCI